MEKLRLGVVGVGSVVREIYQYLYYRSDYSHLLDVVAVADPNDQFRNWFCDTFNIPAERRFKDYGEMFAKVELDAAQINTPDHIHAAPAIAALEAGLDVLVPKPTAATIKDAHAMLQAAKRTGKLLGIDFHKREDPRIKEAEARYQSGRYGRFQSGVWFMLDKLLVADPNHVPMFFATPNFAERNTPISFLTVHMCDALIKIVDLRPVEVRSVGFSHKLPSLSPIAVKGFDLCDTEIIFANGAIAHIITGWHVPNTAHALTVQSSRMICSEAVFDLGIDTPGLHELHPDGIFEINPLFRNFEKDGTVTGYGISSPGRIYQKFIANHNGHLTDEVRQQMMNPTTLGFYTSLVLQGAEESLAQGKPIADGVTRGVPIDLKELLRRELGPEALSEYGY
ncbi:MAG: Gfo/Idh/MocA family oxidoreductase [Lentisphaerae bacterium]|jgi:predicted dehydrogenase|nr:Gfo/Idh/MocA family oxidoreductase [Lentisphaerota bacterium]